MPNITHHRKTIGSYLGQVLTPEIAAEIELAMRQEARDKVFALEDSMMGMEPAECPIRHYFAPGQYAREMTVPKGVVAVGAVHKTDNLVILSKGRLLLATPGGPVEISAPHTLICKAGTKNSALALEDSVWTNFFPTDETDTDKLVELLTDLKACEVQGGSENKQLLAFAAAQKLEN